MHRISVDAPFTQMETMKEIKMHSEKINISHIQRVHTTRGYEGYAVTAHKEPHKTTNKGGTM